MRKSIAARALAGSGLALLLAASTAAAGMRMEPRGPAGRGAEPAARAQPGAPAERPGAGPAAQAAAPSGRPGAGAGVAIAAFANVSGAAGDDWFGAGIAATLAAALEAGGVRTVGADAVGPSGDAARWRIEGAYQRLGDQLRITARLVGGRGGVVARTSIVDGAAADLFALQDRLAAELLDAVRVAAGDARSATAVPTGAAGGDAAAGSGSGIPARGATADAAAGAAPPLRPAPPAPAGLGPAPAPTAAARRVIDGPPAPVAPSTVSRDAAGQATVRAVRLSEPLRLDGVLDEGVYEVVPAVSDFLQQVPIEGAPATEKTEAWVFFDDEHVYVAARLWDSTPESNWVANEMQRDSFQLIQNDYFSMGFDTFYDRRNAFVFMINPLGGFFDYQITDEGNPNNDWNPIWDSRTGRFDGGWTVETQVPFKSLRFQPGATQLWGLQLGRRIRWKNEQDYLTRVPISGGPGMFRISAAGTLTGMEVPQGNRTFEIKPYAIGGLATDLNARPDPIRNDGAGDVGVDVKFGVTENLTADFTYNTDFAQVEVDEQQVNLTRFSLFFPEKRDFFLESRGIFDFGRGANFGGGGGGGGGTRRTGFFGGGDAPIIFFSRRIGLEQTREGISRTVPIVGGGRLTGKVGPFSIGALGIRTGTHVQAHDTPGAGRGAGETPTNFTVLRVSRDILRRSRIGGIYTGRSVSLTAEGANEVFGADGQFAFFDNVYVNGYYARSRTAGREGDDASYQGAFTYNGDLFAMQLDHLRVGSNFNPEMGFLRRTDFRRTFATANYGPRPRGIAAVRQFTFGASLDYIETGAGAVETRIAQVRFQTEFENSDRLTFDVQDNYELLVRPLRLTAGAAVAPGAHAFQDFYASYSMGAQRRVSGTFTLQQGGFYDGTITSLGYRRPRIEVTPQFSLEPGVSVNRIVLPGGEATIPLVTSRVTYTLSPRMFFGGLVQYNSSNATLSTNLRLRWEYQPGSELFVVYNDQRDTTLRGAPFLENRAFIVKLTRLFRF